MPDAEPDNPQDAPDAPPPEDAGQETSDAATPHRKIRLFLILCAGVAFAAGGAG